MFWKNYLCSKYWKNFKIIEEKINSPTFVVSKVYKIRNNEKWKKLIHIDAYRLNGENDIKNIGLDRQMKNPKNIIFIEWAEKIWKKLPENFQKISFEYLSENEREILMRAIN